MQYIVLLLLISSSLAQTVPQRRVSHPAAAHDISSRLKSVHVVGTTRFTDAEITAASGLKVGEMVDDAKIQKASDRLGSFGMFSELAWLSKYDPARGAQVEFRVKDMDKFVPLVFDNFVWLPREELLKRISNRVPLFRGEMPLAGEMGDHVSTAIAEELHQIGLNGTPKFLFHASLNQPIDSVTYTVEGVNIPIRAVQFEGASQDVLLPLNGASARIVGEGYARSRIGIIAKHDFLPIFLQRGYLRADFGDVSTRLAGTPPADNSVDVVLPVRQGAQYRLAAVRWDGNAVYSNAELDQALHAPLGAVCDQIKLRGDADVIAKLFGVRGYMETQIDLAPEFNDAEHTVIMHMHVKENDQYRMGALTIEGVDPQTIEHLRAQWKLKPGDVYDISYPKLFFMSPQVGSLLMGSSIQTREVTDPKTKTVAVTIQLHPRTPR